MNKNLNLVEILKDCPKGTKLYSTIFGEVEFIEIMVNNEYPIKCRYKNVKNNINVTFVTTDGRYCFTGNGECTLFPSKDQRDWSKFNIEPKFNINTLQPFDKVLVRSANNELWLIDFFSHIIKNNDIPSPIFCCMSSVPQQCILYNTETEHLVGTDKMPPKKYITWEK
jgi:hypothetical protein